MAKSSNQKLKLLYLMHILNEKTDEQHPMTVAQMIESLAAYDISAERKSIYDDIEALRSFGMDIIQTRTKTTGYYVGSRDFELAELKLLVDSVQSSKFITQKKTLSLIKKIESLASAHEGQALQRQVFVRNRVKTMNESVYYNIDEISNAINSDRIIRFKYFEYTVSKERRFRKNGSFYEVSPLALLWDDENYYMLGWDSQAEKIKHYRVDKMSEISATGSEREGKKELEKLDLSSYTKTVFGMYSGAKQRVQLRFANHLVGAVIDRFGRDIVISSSDIDRFTVSVEVAISPQFFGWLFGFGDDVEVLAPESVRSEMRQRVQQVAAKY